MSHPGAHWRPALDGAGLRRRAQALAEIRAFFRQRDVLEVDTPVLGAFGVTDPHLSNLWTRTADGRRLALQTSPESAMKRCLAAQSGPIFQLGPAFRDDESGRLHSTEFTLLEWYRPGLDTDALMDEITALVSRLAGRPLPDVRIDYGDAFAEHSGVAHDAPTAALARAAERFGLGGQGGLPDRADLCDGLFAFAVQPRLGSGLVYVTRYPMEQAAMAAPDPDKPSRSLRFELFWDGLELANGWQELTDAAQQARRFEADRQRRARLGRPDVQADTLLLAALEQGLPDCSGVALGVDRLLMRLWGAESLDAVRPFGRS